MSGGEHIGRSVSRVDGRDKVTGAAKYAAELEAPDLAYGHVVCSEVARGRIVRIDAADALALPGVLHVLTHENAPRLAASDACWQDEVAPPGSPFRPLQDAHIAYSGQPVALVVAESLELARHAATLVRVDYERAPHATDLERERQRAVTLDEGQASLTSGTRGDADGALARAPVKVDAEFRVPFAHHNPLETFAATVLRGADGTLTVHAKTQGAHNVHDYLCRVFECPPEEIRVVSRFVGGAFGLGLRPQYPVLLAVMAARALERSVRVALTRPQMFGLGYRPATWQRVALGARPDGTLDAIVHEAVGATSQFEKYAEPVVNWSGLLYRCPDVRLDHRVARLDLYTPADMRAPGAVWGVYALECAMDELASALGMDPLELRLKNYAERDGGGDRPFSSKALRACYRLAADRFGWARRDPRPGSMRDGELLVGWGMATGIWEATQQKASAKAVLTADGRLTVRSGTADIGTGTYTIMAQIAAETFGLPLENVRFELGDSSLPRAPVEGGSFTAATVGTAVQAACAQLREKWLALARQLEPSAHGVTIGDALRHGGVDRLEAEASTEPGRERKAYATNTHSAVFAEVKIDPDLGVIRVDRVVTAVASGRVVNPKTARSQVLGGIVWGIGSALEEASVVDHAFGRFMNHDLAGYHVPVNADVRDLEVILVSERDDVVNPLGLKGFGEIGCVGVAAAIANAVYHATGRRVRDLPITLDELP